MGYQPGMAMVGTEAMAAADLNGDTFPDFLVLDFDGAIKAFNVVGNTLLWTSVPHAAGSRQEIATADFDGDGVFEIVTTATASERVFVHSRTSGSSYSQTAEITLADLLDIAIGDADGDEIPEIYAATYGDSRFTTRVYRLDERLQLLSSFDLDWPAGHLAIEDSPSGRRNVIAFENAGQFVVLDAVSGAEVWRSPPLLGQVRDVRFVALEGDSTPEITVTMGRHDPDTLTGKPARSVDRTLPAMPHDRSSRDPAAPCIRPLTALDRVESGMDFADALHLGKAGYCEAIVTFDRKFIKTAKAIGVETVREA